MPFGIPDLLFYPIGATLVLTAGMLLLAKSKNAPAQPRPQAPAHARPQRRGRAPTGDAQAEPLTDEAAPAEETAPAEEQGGVMGMLGSAGGEASEEAAPAEGSLAGMLESGDGAGEEKPKKKEEFTFDTGDEPATAPTAEAPAPAAKPKPAPSAPQKKRRGLPAEDAGVQIDLDEFGDELAKGEKLAGPQIAAPVPAQPAAAEPRYIGWMRAFDSGKTAADVAATVTDRTRKRDVPKLFEKWQKTRKPILDERAKFENVRTVIESRFQKGQIEKAEYDKLLADDERVLQAIAAKLLQNEKTFGVVA